MGNNRILHTPSDPQFVPQRFLFRQGKDFYRFVDLQVVAEGENSLSVYMRPPLEYRHIARKPDSKIPLLADGKLEINPDSDITKGKSCINPYLSWHGSGRSHINAYSTTSSEQEVVLKDSPAIRVIDTVVRPQIIFTGIFPVSTLSHVKVDPSSIDFENNYVEISNKPYSDTRTDKNTVVYFVIDMAVLKHGSIIMDVMVHNRGSDLNLETNHPYTPDVELYSVANPLKIAPSDTLSPAVTIFFYQPINRDLPIIIKQPSTLWAHSKDRSQNLIVQYVPI